MPLYAVAFVSSPLLLVQLDFQAVVQRVRYLAIFGFGNEKAETKAEQSQAGKQGKGERNTEGVGLEEDGKSMLSI